ncbi:MAG: hypothetical protein MZV63_42650 [Marinilabiliales bacterium]|nr:hypothetical protein [Marinilabiliales bacterium]
MSHINITESCGIDRQKLEGRLRLRQSDKYRTATCSLTAAPGLPFHEALSITTITSPVAPVTLGRVRVSDESPHEATHGH